jgi:Domain of unknown function (DUF4915)
MGTAPEPALEFRDIRCSHSENLPELLSGLRLSILISTYQTGHVVVVAARHGRLFVAFHQFERAMGIAVKPATIAVCTRHAQGSLVRARGPGHRGEARAARALRCRLSGAYVALHG